MTSHDIAEWMDAKLEALKNSTDLRDMRMVLDILKVRSQLKLDDVIIKTYDVDGLSEEQLLKKLKELE